VKRFVQKPESAISVRVVCVRGLCRHTHPHPHPHTHTHSPLGPMVMPSCTPLHSVGKAKHYWRRAMGPEDLNTYVKTLRPQRTYASAPVGPQCNAYQRLARKHGTNLVLLRGEHAHRAASIHRSMRPSLALWARAPNYQQCLWHKTVILRAKRHPPLAFSLGPLHFRTRYDPLLPILCRTDLTSKGRVSPFYGSLPPFQSVAEGKLAK
jgi:hypothetical protein